MRTSAPSDLARRRLWRRDAGDAHHIAVTDQRDVRAPGQLDCGIEARQGQHADRASWSMDQLDIGRQQVLHAEMKDSVRVSATKFHQMVSAARLDLSCN